MPLRSSVPPVTAGAGCNTPGNGRLVERGPLRQGLGSVPLGPSFSAEHSTEPVVQRCARVLQGICFEGVAARRRRQCASLLIAESAANVGRRDFADLIAVDESQAAGRGHDDAVEQILLRDLKNMLDRAELFPGLR